MINGSDLYEYISSSVPSHSGPKSINSSLQLHVAVIFGRGEHDSANEVYWQDEVNGVTQLPAEKKKKKARKC